ncbi:MAG TPA: type II toxin-antitoxin system RelE/ParE family toxin [Nitrospirae bacterium]|jgi:mRNA interferase RelE/StbE|nr:type II toxin-antitoxin system RelE/ParE family toxin [Nitrospirota bacterium]HDO25029.1 type II toxin-antitoxin system RelE/ParE family toxin [Nitrospirota bacterium]
MTGRRLRMSADTAEFIRTLHPEIKRKIKASLETILKDANSGKGLRDELEGLRSFRVGKMRIVCRPAQNSKIIEVAAVGPRRTIYEETLRLLRRGRK